MYNVTFIYIYIMYFVLSYKIPPPPPRPIYLHPVLTSRRDFLIFIFNFSFSQLLKFHLSLSHFINIRIPVLMVSLQQKSQRRQGNRSGFSTRGCKVANSNGYKSHSNLL